jgi:hypothetical protein
MSNDYLIRIAGLREVLADLAYDENRTLGINDWRILDEAATNEDGQLLGGYTDVWIERDRPLGSTDFDSPKPRVAGVRVHGASGKTYQALLPSGHPRSPLRTTSGDDAVIEALEIMQAELSKNPIPTKRAAALGKRKKVKAPTPNERGVDGH